MACPPAGPCSASARRLAGESVTAAGPVGAKSAALRFKLASPTSATSHVAVAAVDKPSMGEGVATSASFEGHKKRERNTAACDPLLGAYTLLAHGHSSKSKPLQTQKGLQSTGKDKRRPKQFSRLRTPQKSPAQELSNMHGSYAVRASQQ